MTYKMSDNLRRWREEREPYTVGQKLATAKPLEQKKKRKKTTKKTGGTNG